MHKILFGAFDLLWKVTEISDNKNHASQSLPLGIKEENNFAYIDDGDRYHLLDAYYPENNNGALPVIIDIHGGGWMYADKELNKIYCQNIAARGYIVFNLSYRLVPNVTVHQQLRDVSAALKWINENLDRFPADRSRIMLTGDSAGGQLSAYTAALSVSEPLRRTFETEDHGLKFNCVTLTSPVAYMNTPGYLGIYGRLMWGEEPFKRSVKPYLNFDEIIDFAPELPPTLIITSSGDMLALKQSRAMHELLMAKGIETCMFEFPKFEGKNLPHVFAVLKPESKPGRMCIEKMCDFFETH